MAIIGQSAFAVDVFHNLRQHGHKIVGIFTIMDKGNREDPLGKLKTIYLTFSSITNLCCAAKIGRENDVPVFKIKSYRRAGKLLPDIYSQYISVNADINVLPYCTQFIPMEIINYPRFRSICYHPSILPRHRGASAINWTLICGDKEAGLTIFWPDDGLDTGPIILQDKCDVLEDDTVDSLYKRFLYPAGVKAVGKAVDLVANGTAPRETQSEKGATYEAMLNKPELQEVS